MLETGLMRTYREEPRAGRHLYMYRKIISPFIHTETCFHIENHTFCDSVVTTVRPCGAGVRRN